MILNHLFDGDDEYLVADMTAGADAIPSGLFTRFDRTVVVCEPTVRSRPQVRVGMLTILVWAADGYDSP